MSRLLATAQRAFDTVPVYRALYGSRPERGEDIPFISGSAFHRARGPLDIVTAAAKVRGAVPTFSRGARRLPVTMLESEDEWRLRLDRLRHALAAIGLPPGPGRRYAIVTNDASGPFAGDVSNFLAWDQAECSIVFLSASLAGLDSTLAALEPEAVLVAGPLAAVSCLGRLGARVAAFVPADAPADDILHLDRLLVSDELFVIGAAPAGDRDYRFDERSLLVETDPASGRVAVTTPAFDCCALVRYCLDLPANRSLGHAGF